MKARTVVVGRGERARYVTPDLSYYWEGAREQCEDNEWDGEKKYRETLYQPSSCIIPESKIFILQLGQTTS